MGNKNKIFRSESELVSQLEDMGRIGREIELGRLKFILSTTISNHTEVDKSTTKKGLIGDLNNYLDKKYERTRMLDGTEMKHWHLSMFTCLEQFRKTLSIDTYSDPDEIKEEFTNIMNRSFEKNLRRQTDSYEDIKQKLNLVSPPIDSMPRIHLLIGIGESVTRRKKRKQSETEYVNYEFPPTPNSFNETSVDV